MDLSEKRTINGEFPAIVFEKCFDRFAPSVLKVVKKPGMGEVIYVSIDSFYQALDSTFESNWSTEISQPIVTDRDVVVTAHIGIYYDDGVLARRVGGVGGDMLIGQGRNGEYRQEIDKAIKTAHAESIKKCCHQLGMGRYLWDEEERSAAMTAMSGHHYALSKGQSETLKGLYGGDKEKLSARYNQFNGPIEGLQRHNADEFIRFIVKEGIEPKHG
jgi:hypothetical protein